MVTLTKPKPKEQRVVQGISFPPPILKKLNALADHSGVNRSAVVQQLVVQAHAEILGSKKGRK